MSTIFVIDDDRALCRSLKIQLEGMGHEVWYAVRASDGIAELSNRQPDMVLLDLNLPDRNGIDVLEDLQGKYPDLPVVMITGQQDTKSTIQAMRSGAFDYVRKPFEIDDIVLLLEKLQHFNTSKKTKISEVTIDETADTSHEIIGNDKKIIEVLKQIGLLSKSGVTVLIEGESGTGKELVARAIHEATDSGEPFVAINCSAVVPTLLESELFGHEKGAFTGAVARKIGKLEQACNGTIFFDEISDMPIDLQAKMLRILQEREFVRVGNVQSISFHARVITSTNRDLRTLVEEGKFREDLYFRVAVSRITLPSLRERRGDIPLLVRHLVSRISCRLHREISGVEDHAMRRLQNYDWPGNVRELENVLTRAIALARGKVLMAGDLEISFDGAATKSLSDSDITPLRQVEKEYIEKALIVTDWNITRTAKALQISPTTLRKKITDFGLQKPI